SIIPFYPFIILPLLLLSKPLLTLLPSTHFTYPIQHHQFPLQSPLITKNKKYISLQPIQTLNTTQPIFHPIFPFLTLQI
ncbi:hypothetical protein, partial [Bacillus pumilus]|uniref:hypothetical protein n=1 Tax=Bacillus pumilus TaxID=1408 RepID=UPI003F689B7E